MADLEYEGQIYIRPVGRGVCLSELDSKDLSDAIEDAVAARYGTGSGWTGSVKITVEVGIEAGEAPDV